jgi:hypothetical protein
MYNTPSRNTFSLHFVKSNGHNEGKKNVEMSDGILTRTNGTWLLLPSSEEKVRKEVFVSVGDT